MGHKTYTVEGKSGSSGRYKSDSPSGAAKKAASVLFRKAKKGTKKMKVCIRETTSGSDKKVFEYWATRVKLAKPVEREINGVKVVNKYKITVKACKTKATAAKRGGDCGCGK